MTTNTCKSLYVQCLEFWIPKLENDWRERGEKNKGCEWLEDLAAPVVEDMLTHAFYLANHQNKSINKIWKEEWKMFFTSKITSAILTWDLDLINYISDRCKNLRKCHVVVVKSFRSDLVLKLPKSVSILDFDGELINRGKTTKTLLFEEDATESWLPHAEGILRSLREEKNECAGVWRFWGGLKPKLSQTVIERKRTQLESERSRKEEEKYFIWALHTLRTPPAEYTPTPNIFSLSELHLGTVSASSSDLKTVIKNCPNLRLLRHYQMVTALYELHSEARSKKQLLPKYKLKNLDVDFSHVVRCRMSPEWVLSPDALQLAVTVCPFASSIRVRFDCSTPHDVLAPLLNLSKVKEFSAVCVSSGERTLLDFSDMAPIFEKFGPSSLSFLELKVIEEVEIHVIIECCTKVETLILSGCGYVTPPTCSSFNCQTYEKGSLKKLRSLFYADGDDFSWDSGVPECFWKASLCPSGKTRPLRLQGLFLEHPRMSASQMKEIFQTGPTKSPPKLPFPELRALSLCRFQEITANEIAAVCGISPSGDTTPCQHLKYIRLSDCENMSESEEKRLKAWLRHSRIGGPKVEVDR